MSAQSEVERERTPSRGRREASKASGYGLIIAAIVAIGVGLVVFVTSSGGQSELTIAKVTATPDKYENRKLRVVGTIKQGSTASLAQNGRPETRFSIIDEEGRELPIVYRQALPDPYQEGRSAIVEGTFADGVVEANRLTVKCPSKYQSENGEPSDYDAYRERYMNDAPAGPRS
ncbi:MAG: cytochrome c maturation protein CcmE [Deltaproteobacteria bacterium]|nr:cytochrome c maturation protein CcmE [Deltaproteobacteria bacterium]